MPLVAVLILLSSFSAPAQGAGGLQIAPGLTGPGLQENSALPPNLEEALAQGSYFSFRVDSLRKPFDLGGQKISFEMGTDSVDPLDLVIFSDVGGFSPANAIFSTQLAPTTSGRPTVSFIVPPQGFGPLSGSVQFRAYVFGANILHSSLTSLSNHLLSQPGPLFNVQLRVFSGGTVNTFPSGSWFEAGTDIQILASPNPNNIFQGWSGDVTGLGNPRTITVNQDMRITGNFDSLPSPDMSLGMNLAGVQDWSTSWAFVDVFKTARTWSTRDVNNQSVWNSGMASEMSVDGNGWPTGLPFLASDGNDHFAHTLMPAPDFGTYTVHMEGTGEVRIIADATSTEYSPTGGAFSSTFVIPSGEEGSIAVEILRSAVLDPIRKISVVRPGFDNTYQTLFFHPKFTERLRPFEHIRFTGWSKTSNSPVVSWSDRTTPDTYTQTGVEGVALEHVISLVNEMKVDLWINIPHQADDDFIRQMATLIKTTMNQYSKVYVEYSNETWNNTFDQAAYVQNTGFSLGLSDDYWQAGNAYHVLRSTQAWSFFLEIFNNDPTRIVKVMGGRASMLSITGLRFQYLNDPTINPNYLMPDVVAIAPYFGRSYSPEDIPPIAPSYPTVDDMLDVVAANAIAELRNQIIWQTDIARAQGAQLVCYEGGQHFHAIEGAEADATLMGLMQAANRDLRMKDTYTRYLDMLHSERVGVFNNFSYVEAWNRFGSWGVLEYQNQPYAEAPKYRALAEWHQPSIVIRNLVAGGQALLSATYFTPSQKAYFACSFTGPGPTTTPWGLVSLSNPIINLPAVVSDPVGTANLPLAVPAGATGIQIWIQALDLRSGTLSNPLAEVVG